MWNTRTFTNICFKVITIVQKVCLYASKLSDCNLTETPPVPYHFTLRINDCAVVCPIKPTHSLSRAPDRSNRLLHSLRKRSGVSWGVSGVIGNHDTVARLSTCISSSLPQVFCNPATHADVRAQSLHSPALCAKVTLLHKGLA